MPPVIGMRFGRYELLGSLGAGGMGEVWRARDHDLHREVAVKFLPERFASDPMRLGRFAQEARAASSLNHPHIVTIHEIGETSGLPFIVMELVQGQTLRELLAGGALPIRRLLEIGAQLAGGLAKAHTAGIVHRDLKPENVMVTSDHFVKILDFGLAKLRGDDTAGVGALSDDTSRPDGSQGSPAERTSTAVASSAPTDAAGFWPESWLRTAAGAVVGTVGYMSPEQVRGRGVDHRSDQFALGAILYEMATGRQAFRRETPAHTLAAIIEGQPEPIALLNPAFPAPARWTVERCLSKEPANRYASTLDLALELQDLREHLSEVTHSSAPSGAGLPVASAGRSRAIRIGGGILVAVALAGLGAAFVPSARERIAVGLSLRALPSEKRIAILPFRAATANDEDRALADGLAELLTVRLAQIERFQQALSVEPSSNVRQSGVASVDTAARALGATLVVSGSVQRVEGRLVLTAALDDVQRRRTLRADAADSPEALAAAVIRMLELELDPAAEAELTASRTSVAEAATLSTQALGFTPYAEGRSLLERYDQAQSLERAIELFNRALERDPRYVLAHAGLGQAYWRLYRATRRPEYVPLARQHCERALALDDLLAPAWVTLGMIEAGTGHGEQAVGAFRKALDREPRSAEAYRELGFAFERLGRTAEAEATYRRAIELRPQSWSALNHLGALLYGQGHVEEAEAAFARALEIAPDNPRVWTNLGAARFGQDRFAEAEPALQRAIDLRPTPAALSNLATLQFYKGRFAEAAQTLERATQDGTRDYRVWMNLGATLRELPGRREDMIAAFRRAAALAEEERKIDPRDPRLLVLLADCRAVVGERDNARALVLEALRIGPADATLAAMAADVYETLGDREVALRWLGAAMGSGYPLQDVERSRALRDLRADKRYAAIVAGAAENQPKRP